MGQILHGSATTTEAVRGAIQHSQESLRGLAKRYGVNPKTVARAPSEPIESEWDSRIIVDLIQASAGLEAGRDGRAAFHGSSQTCVGSDC